MDKLLKWFMILRFEAANEFTAKKFVKTKNKIGAPGIYQPYILKFRHSHRIIVM